MTRAVRGLALLSMAAAIAFGAAVGRTQDAPGSTPAPADTSADGERIYQDVCQACHMADAKGGGGAGAMIPALAGNTHLADPNFGIDVLIKGRGGMPWFTEMLTPAQLAAVLTYVRGHFNAYADPVNEADVRRRLVAAPKRDCDTCN